MTAPCSICAVNPRRHGMICQECHEFYCDRHGAGLPLVCHGTRVCESCHDVCPHTDDECVDCGRSLDCATLRHPLESITVKESGRCASCAMATGGVS